MTKEMQQMVSLLEPYLKNGVSIRKASIEAKINRASLYRYAHANKEFWEQITAYRNYTAIYVNNTLVSELIKICKKQQGDSKNNLPPCMLKSDEIRLIQWFVVNTNFCKEEYGKETTRYSPQTKNLVTLEKIYLGII